MRTAFILIVIVHALIHLLGFVKGFGWKEIKELTLPISKPLAMAWLSASVLFLIFGVLHLMKSGFAGFAGLAAVFISQVLIVLIWKDAKAGTIPNILVLVVSMVLTGQYLFQQRVQGEIRLLLDKNGTTVNREIGEKDILNLPDPVQKWLRHCGAVGKPFIHGGKVSQTAEMQMKPEQENWLPATAIQYTTIDHPGFIWSVDVKMNGLLNFQGRDKYDEGKGEMLIKLNSLINIVNERGEKLDEGTLQRFLGEMVWFPSLALSPYVKWEPIDGNTARAVMNYQGASGAGTFHFNSGGDVIRFSALRYKGNEADAKRQAWAVNVLDYKTFEGIRVPSKIISTWKLDDKDWTWLKMEVRDIQFNLQAGQ